MPASQTPSGDAKPKSASSKKPISEAIKKLLASKKDAPVEEETAEAAHPPSRFTRAEGAFKKHFGAGKADMLLERMSREKAVELTDRMEKAGKLG